MDIKGKKCAVSGSGNVAIYTIEKLINMGATPITCSDSRGTIYHSDGINLETLKEIKEVKRDSLERYKEFHPESTYIPIEKYPKNSHAVWTIPCDIAFPSATQNELNLQDAKNLVKMVVY